MADKRTLGDLRPSQLLYTFGVGSIVELPNLSVMLQFRSLMPTLLKNCQGLAGTCYAASLSPDAAYQDLARRYLF